MKPGYLLRFSLMACLLFIVTLSSVAQDHKKPIRESIEWLDVYMPNTNDTILPRILLIGNSLTRGYYPDVQKCWKERRM